MVEAAYARLADRASSLDSTKFEDVADQINTQLVSDAPDCEAPLAGAEALLTSADIELPPRDQYRGGDGNFDPCLYAADVALLLSDVAASLGSTGLDAIAFAYPALSFNQHPIGTGPWRFVSVEDGTRAVFAAFDDYHLGRPATQNVEVRVLRAPNAARDGLLSGESTG